MQISIKALIPIAILIFLGAVGLSWVIPTSQEKQEPRQTKVVNHQANIEKKDDAIHDASEKVFAVNDQVKSVEPTKVDNDISDFQSAKTPETDHGEQFKEQFFELNKIEDYAIESTASSYESETTFLNAVAESLAQENAVNLQDENSDVVTTDNQNPSWQEVEQQEQLVQQFNQSHNVQKNGIKVSDDQQFLNSASDFLAR